MTQRIRVDDTHVIHETVDDEVLIIDTVSSNYYGLRDVGAFVWSFVRSNASVDEILDAVADRYQAARETIERAVRGFLEDLSAESLIVLEAAGPDAAASLAGPAASLSVRLPFTLPRLEKFTDLRYFMSP